MAVTAAFSPAEFVRAYLPAARANEASHGVPALLTLAQAALESGWGKHAPGFNFFGIKADPSWKGEKQILKTREVINGVTVWRDEPFRKYARPEDSFADHAAFLRRWPRYATVFETTDPREAARRVAAAGYATDPNYAKSLIEIIGQIEKTSPSLPASPEEATRRPSLFAWIRGWFP